MQEHTLLNLLTFCGSSKNGDVNGAALINLRGRPGGRCHVSAGEFRLDFQQCRVGRCPEFAQGAFVTLVATDKTG